MFERRAINLDSPKQIKEALLKLGIDVDSTNEREISLLNHPVATELLNYRGLQKILSSYGKSFLDKVHPFTGRIHSDFQQLGTETGRFSCKDPNLQQMPAEFRECISSSDHLIVGADYANIELRILAEISGDSALTHAFASGVDPHKSTASLMFNVPIDSVSKEQRFIAKTINFGISYGMGTKKLMDMLNAEAYKNKMPSLKFPQVQDIMNRYHKTYGKATRWLFDAGNLAFRRGYSETLYGRKRFYIRPDPNAMPEKEYDNQVAAIKRKGANSVIQGTNADITKIAMIDLHHDLYDAGFKANIIIQVHDEVVVLARKDQAEAVKIVVQDSMNRSATKIIKNVPIKTDAYIAEGWKK
jgi:DNA polymerase I-like protein with 3'-5' exonuclease and polymerase domains